MTAINTLPTTNLHYTYKTVGQLILVNVGDLNVGHIACYPEGFKLYFAGQDEPAGGGELLPTLAACEHVLGQAALLALKAKLGA